MGTLLIAYDERGDRLAAPRGLPSDMHHVLLKTDGLPDNPEGIRGVAEQLAELLMRSLTAKE